MELQKLERFLTIAESDSISRASSIIGVGQPALSRQIKELEEELGAQLFYRHGRGIRLTEAGAAFRSVISPLVSKLVRAGTDFKAESRATTGNLHVAMPPTMSHVIGHRVVESFITKFPKVNLHVSEGFSGYVNEWLVAGRVDMAIVNKGRRSIAVRMDPLATVELFFVIHRDIADADSPHPKTIAFDRLCKIPMILPGRDHGLRRELDMTAQKRGAELKLLVEVDSLAALKDLINAKVGPTVLPHGTVISATMDSAMVVRRVVKPEVTMTFMIAYSVHRPVSSAMRELARTIRSEIHNAIIEGRVKGWTT
jgi:LysR family transcriptional regulator, nitrogen assimilation regulatory protein